MSYYDETAERAILGVAMMNPSATSLLDPADFYRWQHADLWRAIAAVHSEGLKPDAATVLPRVSAEHVAQLGALMVEVVGQGVVGNVDAYAATIRDRAERRRVESILQGIRQRLDSPETAAADTLAWAERELVGDGGEMDRIAETVQTLDEFLDQELPAVEWLIPSLLASGERLVLTGVEGFGKSVLMRQIGVATAAGIDPFSLAAMPPKRVLIVDCENPVRIMIDRLSDLRSVIRRRSQSTGDRLWIKRFPQGLDLAQPRDRMELHHLCRIISPDLLLIGPAYKLYVGGSNSREEDLARQVTSVLDGLREEFGFSLILEHHSPHGSQGEARNVRPIGSSLWLRWPEFGLGLRPRANTKPSDRLADLIPWRGGRDERPWPKQLKPGGDGNLPWVDDYQLQQTDYEPYPHRS